MPQRKVAFALAGVAVLATVVALLVASGGRTERAASAGAAADAGVAPRVARPGTGGETLAGTVVDAGGVAVGDVRIVATPEIGAGEEVVAYAGADGAFSLVGLVPGSYRLVVEGGDVFTAEVRYVPVPSDGVRIAVARRVSIHGTVVDGGRPVAGARVTIDGESLGRREEAVTASDGGFAFEALPEGTYRVWAHEGDLASRTTRVPRLGAGPFPEVTLVLEPATIVVGRVVDRATGIGVEAAVALEPADGAAEAARFVRTRDDGQFRIEGVPHGRWLVDAWAPGWLSTGALEIHAGRGMPEIEVIAGGILEGRVVDARGRPVVGAAVRASGGGGGALAKEIEASAGVEADRLRRFSGFAPAGGVGRVGAMATSDFAEDPRFVPRGELGVLLGPLPYPPKRGVGWVKQAQIVAAAGTGTGTGPEALVVDPAVAARYVTDDQGRFRITGLEAARWTVVASAPGMADGKAPPVALEPGKVVADVEIVLTPGTFLVGEVTSARGGPLAGVAIQAGGALTVSDRDGRYRVGPLVGDVVVRATRWGHGEERVELVLPPVEGDRPADQELDLVLTPADATLRGRVVDPDGLPVRGATIEVAAGRARGRRAVTDDTGWFTIASVPHGDATIAVEHAAFPPQRVPIATTEDARVALAWGGSVAGVVLDRHTGAPLAGIPVSVRGAGASDEVASNARGELAIGPLLPGAYTLRVQVPGYLAVERALDVPAGARAGEITVRDLRIELERGALLAGVVRDRYGTRLPGATVVVERDDGGRVSGRADGDGEFRLRDVPTGEVTVRVERGGLAGSQTLTLRPGDERLGLVIDVR